MILLVLDVQLKAYFGMPWLLCVCQRLDFGIRELYIQQKSRRHRLCTVVNETAILSIGLSL